MSDSLYIIDEKIYALIDPETGEIENEEAFEALQMEREQKIENIALWLKNLQSEAEAIKREEEALRERRTQRLSKVDRLKRLLEHGVGGQRFSTPKVDISFRKSPPSAVIDDESAFIVWAEKEQHHDLLKYETPTPRKAEIKKAIDGGTEIPFVRIVQNTNIQIK